MTSARMAAHLSRPAFAAIAALARPTWGDQTAVRLMGEDLLRRHLITEDLIRNRIDSRQGLHLLMASDINFDAARIYAIPMRTRFRRITVREGMLIEGPAGWGEFCPFPEYDDVESVPWLAAALEAAEQGWPEPVRDRVPVNAIVPAVGPERAHE
ncbi:MAG: hypothetical protein M3300_04705, partial [Actinomycetota bacterium]|nr:hypothetical protein [Actinomycetota bacterium]